MPDGAYLPIEKRIANRLTDKKKKKKKKKRKPNANDGRQNSNNTKSVAKTAEDANLKLEWVYWFYDTGTSNVQFSSTNGSELAYPAAGVAVVYNF